jgi:hypothetical protein
MAFRMATTLKNKYETWLKLIKNGPLEHSCALTNRSKQITNQSTARHYMVYRTQSF